MIALHILFFVALAFLLWKFCWKRYALDKFRQELFAIRNRLFELAMESGDDFSYEHEIYNKMWDQINGLIRFGHWLSGDFILLTHWLLKIDVNGRPLVDELNELSRIDLKLVKNREMRAQLISFQGEISKRIFFYLISVSPLILMYTVGAVLFALGREIHSRTIKGLDSLTAQSMRPIIEYVKRQAMEVELEGHCAA